MLIYSFVLLLGAFCCFLFSKYGFIDFETIENGVFNDDGFNSQILYAIDFIRSGYDLSQYGFDGYLLYIHVARLFVSEFFYYADKAFGLFGQVILIYLIIWFGTFLLLKSLDRPWLLYLTSILPIFLSWRSVLTMMVVFYMYNYFVFNNRRYIYFCVAAIFSSLSSASVLYSSILIFWGLKKRLLRFDLSTMIPILFIYLMLVVVVGAKYIGFVEGLDGYSIDESDNPFESIILRSTFVIKFIHADFYKKLFYGIGLAGAIYFFLRCVLDNKKTIAHYMFLFSVLGLFVEGLGAMLLFSSMLLLIASFKINKNSFINITDSKTKWTMYRDS